MLAGDQWQRSDIKSKRGVDGRAWADPRRTSDFEIAADDKRGLSGWRRYGKGLIVRIKQLHLKLMFPIGFRPRHFHFDRDRRGAPPPPPAPTRAAPPHT